MMNEKPSNDPSVQFLYNSAFGRFILKLILKSHVDRIAVRFLWSPASRFIIRGFAKKHKVPLSDRQLKSFRSYRDFFARKQRDLPYDQEPTHLISPCDGWLSYFPIEENSSFAIKDSHYRLCDILKSKKLAEKFHDGDCLIFRLCASDYHHYCYIDDGIQGKNHEIPGVLHSVQPIACETYPVYVLNRRCWTLLKTEHFGPVIQTEIGALIVGGIKNHHENTAFRKGSEKGQFELAGSTIVLLFQKGQVRLTSEIRNALLHHSEVRVTYGSYIGDSVSSI